MLLVLAVLGGAVVVGWLSGGTLRRLGDRALRDWPLIPAALATQLAGTWVGRPLYPAGLVGSALLVTVFLARNRGVRGTGLVAAGLLLNAMVVGANGAMPVDPVAASRAGLDLHGLDLDGLIDDDPRHDATGPGTRLRWLGDRVPVPLPGVPQVVSPGDVLVAAGLGQLVVTGMSGRLPGRRRRQSRPVPDPRLWQAGSRRPADRSDSDGQEGPQEEGAQEEQGQPRQPPQRLSGRSVS